MFNQIADHFENWISSWHWTTWRRGNSYDVFQ